MADQERRADEFGDDNRISLRELLVHVADEYARHTGHVDFDGRIGQ